MVLQPGPHPEVEQLRELSASLRATLQQTMDEYARLTSEEHQRLMHVYDVNFGALESIRQQLTLECAELFRRVELLSIKVARGETITPEIVALINKVVDKEYERLYHRLRDASRAEREHREQQAGEYGNATENSELASMYRALAKRLHPDAAAQHSQDGGVDESINLKRRRDWDRVQEAYRRRNVSRLRSMLTALSDNEVEVLDEGTIERLRANVEALETRVRIEKRRLTRLRLQEPFSIARELDNETWRQQHKSELEQAVQAKRHELEQHREQYKALANADVPKHTPVPGSDKDFDSDFMDNTYFGAR